MSTDAITQARRAAPVNASVITVQIFPDQQNPAIPVFIAVPGSGRLEQMRFKVRASGSATTVGATTTFAPSLVPGAVITGPAAPLGILAATVVNTATTTWWIEAQLIFDSISGKLTGQFTGMINNTIIAAAAITPILGLNGSNAPAGTEPVFQVSCGATFGVNAASGNVARLAELVLEF